MATTTNKRFRVVEPPDKLAELMLYIAKHSQGDPTFSATKLNKILFFADFTAYGRLGKLITGQTYQKLEFGPAPNGLIPARKKMLDAKHCVIQRVLFFGRPQDRLVPLREPNLSPFTGEEIAIVDEILDSVKALTATEISDKSHTFLGYRLACARENIPPFTVFLAPGRELTATERRYATRLAQRA